MVQRAAVADRVSASRTAVLLLQEKVLPGVEEVLRRHRRQAGDPARRLELGQAQAGESPHEHGMSEPEHPDRSPSGGIASSR